jgi:hypothetical protein
MSTGKDLDFLHFDSFLFEGMSFSPSLRLVAGIDAQQKRGPGSPPPPLRLVDSKTGKEWKSIARRGPGKKDLVFSPDGRTLLDAPNQGQAVLWELASGQPRFEIPCAGASAVAFSRDGRRIALSEGENFLGRRRIQIGDSTPPFAIRIFDLATGQSSVPLTGHRAQVNALAFSPDGKLLASGSDDTTALLWDLDGLLPADTDTTLVPDDRNSAWDDLQGEAKRAYWSMWRLARDPGAVELLRKKLEPAKAPADPALVRRLLADIDSGDSTVRTRATDQLIEQGPAIIPELLRLLEGRPSAEVRASIKILLDGLQGSQLRGFRAIEVLEKINTPASRGLLQKLASGVADAPLTLEAKRPLDGIIELGKASPPEPPKAEPPQPRFGKANPSEPPKAETLQPHMSAPRGAQNAAVIKEEQTAAKAIEKLGGSFTTDPQGSGHIVTVTLIGTNTTDADLKALKGLEKLESLFVGITQVTDAGLEELKGFKNLRTLGVRQTKVTAEGAKKLNEALPQCQILRGGRGN